MLDGMKYATEGMAQIQQKNDMVVNNLANASTIGYRKEGMVITSFAETLDRSMGFNPAAHGSGDQTGYMEAGGGLDTGNALFNHTLTSYQQGPLRETGNKFDMALDDNGTGFFTVATPAGLRYTRAGAFKLVDGKLETADGCQLMGMKGPISVGAGTNMEVSVDGIVKVDGKEVDKLRITTFADKRVLKRDGMSNFAAPSDRGLTLTKGYTVRQGYLEAANVNPVQEMVDIMTISRTFEANQKMLQAEDHLLQTAATQLGKLH
jgi:flagellar basal-body rod protein FlgG